MSLMHILLALSLGGQQPATLSTELLTRGLPVPRDAVALEKAISSYAVLDDERGFVIGYYTAEPDGMLHELHIRAFDKSTQTWRERTFSEQIGSVLSLRRGGRTIYVAGHSSPSAAPLLVLSEALDVKRTLEGWPMLVMRDGRVVFQRSMIHFAPAHAGLPSRATSPSRLLAGRYAIGDEGFRDSG